MLHVSGFDPVFKTMGIHTHILLHTSARTHAHTHTRSHSHTHAHSHTHTHTQVYTHAHTHPLSLSLSLSHTHTNAHTNTHAHTHTHTHTIGKESQTSDFAVCFIVLPCVAVHCSVLQYIAACCSVLRHFAVCCTAFHSVNIFLSSAWVKGHFEKFRQPFLTLLREILSLPLRNLVVTVEKFGYFAEILKHFGDILTTVEYCWQRESVKTT